MAAQQKQQFPRHSVPLPAGRFIAGSFTTIQTKDGQGRERANPSYWIGIAVAKNQPGVDETLARIYAVKEDYRHHQPTYNAATQWLSGPFKWKIFDGDTHEKWKGREGAAGCWIFGLGQPYEIKTVNVANGQPLDRAAIGLGDYVDGEISVVISGLTDQNAGVYLNPDMIRFLQTGPRIQLGKTYEQTFGNRAVVMPVNMLPVTGPANTPPASGQLPPPPGAAPGAPAAPGMTPPPGQLPPPAAPAGFAAGMTPPPGVPNAPAAAPGVPVPPSAGTLPPPSTAPTAAPSHLPPPQVGFSAGPAAPAAPPAPAAAVMAPCYAKQVADPYGVPHTPGWRYVPVAADGTGNTWVADPTSV